MSRDTTVDVGAVEDFPEGTIRIVTARGREIGVSHWDGAFYALRNLCPHQSAPLCAGRLISAIESGGAVGLVESENGAPVIACPWHGWEFRVDNGHSMWDDGYKVRAFSVEISNGRVLVDLSVGRRVVS
jgi:nitrite reductase/ring-hydroxylating ferredoxin subunit